MINSRKEVMLIVNSSLRLEAAKMNIKGVKNNEKNIANTRGGCFDEWLDTG
jgi:hypothetical protein